MSPGAVTCSTSGGIARITFERPASYNAMTFAMYDDLARICADLQGRQDLSAITLRGAGAAFIAGTDICEFTAFASGEDGLAYEARVEEVLAAVEHLPAPTIALVDGPAMGGGLILATVCDLRLLTTRATLGAPIARTVGNTLSSRNLARLERAFGLAPLQRVLLLAEKLTAAEAAALGYCPPPVEPEELEAAAAQIADRLSAHAPVTIAALREGLGRIGRGQMHDDDLVARVYGHADFREGVAAFIEKRRAVWPSRAETRRQ